LLQIQRAVRILASHSIRRVAAEAITESNYSFNGTFTTKEPKSESSRRTVEFPLLARDALRSHQKRELSDGVKKSTWVFCDKEGRPLRGTHVVRDSLPKAFKEGGLPKIRFHDLRQTAATLMLSRGVPLKMDELFGGMTGA
jgi:integrase